MNPAAAGPTPDCRRPSGEWLALVEAGQGLLHQRSGLLDPGLVGGEILVLECLVGLGEQRLGLVE